SFLHGLPCTRISLCNAFSAFLQLQTHLYLFLHLCIIISARIPARHSAHRFCKMFLQTLLFCPPTSLSYLSELNMYHFVTVLCHFDALLFVSANYFCNGLCKSFLQIFLHWCHFSFLSRFGCQRLAPAERPVYSLRSSHRFL